MTTGGQESGVRAGWLEHVLIAALLVVAFVAGWDLLMAGLDTVVESQHADLGASTDH